MSAEQMKNVVSEAKNKIFHLFKSKVIRTKMRITLLLPAKRFRR